MRKIVVTAFMLFIAMFSTFFICVSFSGAQISSVQGSINKSSISDEKTKSTGSGTAATVKSPAASSKTSKTAAASGSSLNSVIADDEFTDFEFMSEAELTSLLNSMNSPMAKEYEGVNPAGIIMEVAKENKVNPLVILATMQKENGLVQTKKKITKFKLDWAMGVGVYDNGKMNQAYKGFKKQITGAAQTFRNNFDKGAEMLASKKSTTLRINYGKDKITPLNAATFSLYSYTPHTHGAKLFTSIYKSYKSKLEKLRASSTASTGKSSTSRISD